MTPKALTRLAAILAALVAATVLAAWWNRPVRAARLAPQGLAEKASRIELQGPSGSLELKRSAQGWLASVPSGYPADDAFVKDTLGKLEAATVSDPLTEDPARYALFGIGASSATRLQVFEGASAAPALDLYVGTDGPDYPSAFVRPAKTSGVVQASGVAATELAKAPGEWLDKDITAANPDSLTRISVKAPTGSWRLETSPAGWTLDGKALPPEKIQELVKPIRDAAAKLEADSALAASAAPSDKDTGLAKPELTVDLSTGVGRFGFVVGSKKDSLGRRYARKDGEARVIFVLADWRLQSFRHSRAEFLKKK